MNFICVHTPIVTTKRKMENIPNTQHFLDFLAHCSLSMHVYKEDQSWPPISIDLFLKLHVNGIKEIALLLFGIIFLYSIFVSAIDLPQKHHPFCCFGPFHPVNILFHLHAFRMLMAWAIVRTALMNVFLHVC